MDFSKRSGLQLAQETQAMVHAIESISQSNKRLLQTIESRSELPPRDISQRVCRPVSITHNDSSITDGCNFYANQVQATANGDAESSSTTNRISATCAKCLTRPQSEPLTRNVRRRSCADNLQSNSEPGVSTPVEASSSHVTKGACGGAESRSTKTKRPAQRNQRTRRPASDVGTCDVQSRAEMNNLHWSLQP